MGGLLGCGARLHSCSLRVGRAAACRCRHSQHIRGCAYLIAYPPHKLAVWCCSSAQALCGWVHCGACPSYILALTAVLVCRWRANMLTSMGLVKGGRSVVCRLCSGGEVGKVACEQRIRREGVGPGRCVTCNPAPCGGAVP